MVLIERIETHSVRNTPGDVFLVMLVTSLLKVVGQVVVVSDWVAVQMLIQEFSDSRFEVLFDRAQGWIDDVAQDAILSSCVTRCI